MPAKDLCDLFVDTSACWARKLTSVSVAAQSLKNKMMTTQIERTLNASKMHHKNINLKRSSIKLHKLPCKLEANRNKTVMSDDARERRKATPLRMMVTFPLLTPQPA